MYGSPETRAFTQDGKMVLVHYDSHEAHTQMQLARENSRLSRVEQRENRLSTKIDSFAHACGVVTHIRNIVGRKLPAYLITSSKIIANSAYTQDCFTKVYETPTLAKFKAAIRELRTAEKGILINAAYVVTDVEFNKRLYTPYIASLLYSEKRHIDVSFVQSSTNLSVTIFSTNPFRYVLDIKRLEALGIDPVGFLPYAKGLTKGR